MPKFKQTTQTPVSYLETLKTQLATTEAELEQAKAHVYRADGAMQLLKHLIAQQTVTPLDPQKDTE